MWEWFFSNEVWVIVASVITLAFLLLSLQRQIKKNTTETAKSKPTKGKVLRLGLWAAGSVSLFILIMALISNAIVQRPSNFVTVSETIQDWLIDRGIPFFIIVVISLVIYQIIKATIPRLIERSVKRRPNGDEQEMTRRAQTLTRIIVSTVGIVILVTAVSLILTEIAPNILPLLAGIGFAGLAIGLGVQSLVKDVLNGLFIIAEDQYRKDDVVTIAGLSGLVEDLSLRRTVLRDRNGTVHIIPNGQIVTVSNMTKDLSRINIDIPVRYCEDIDHVMAIINRVGVELAEDPNYKSLILSAPRTLYVDGFSDKGIIIKVLGETKPLKQWDIAGEFRRRIKIAFDKEGIVIPWAYAGIYSAKKVGGDDFTSKLCRFPNQPSATRCVNCGSVLERTEKQQPPKSSDGGKGRL